MATNTVRFAVTQWGKEHQLTATEPIKGGEVIVSETPLVSVLDITAKYPTFAWELVDKILSSADLTQRYYTLRLKVSKFFMDPEDNRIERDLAKKHRCTRDFVRKLYFSVATNNIGYPDASRQIVGHAIYPIISRANHSCRPNASTGCNTENNALVLVALHDIRAGDAITWSYPQSRSFDDADYTTRNLDLANNFRFVCGCERCQAEIPPELAKLPNLLRYFDDWIMRLARAQIEEEYQASKGGKLNDVVGANFASAAP